MSVRPGNPNIQYQARTTAPVGSSICLKKPAFTVARNRLAKSRCERPVLRSNRLPLPFHWSPKTCFELWSSSRGMKPPVDASAAQCQSLKQPRSLSERVLVALPSTDTMQKKLLFTGQHPLPLPRVPSWQLPHINTPRGHAQMLFAPHLCTCIDTSIPNHLLGRTPADSETASTKTLLPTFITRSSSHPHRRIRELQSRNQDQVRLKTLPAEYQTIPQPFPPNPSQRCLFIHPCSSHTHPRIHKHPHIDLSLFWRSATQRG